MKPDARKSNHEARRNDRSCTSDAVPTARSRTRSTTTGKERATMFATQPGLIELVAQARRADMLNQAERERIRNIALGSAPRVQSPSAVGSVRQLVGAALVRTGQRIHGAP